MNIAKIFCQSLGVTSHAKTFLMVCHFRTDSRSNEFGIHDFHNGGALGQSGNEPHQSEASKATIFISESARVEKHANVFQIYLACRVVLVSLA